MKKSKKVIKIILIVIIAILLLFQLYKLFNYFYKKDIYTKVYSNINKNYYVETKVIDLLGSGNIFKNTYMNNEKYMKFIYEDFNNIASAKRKIYMDKDKNIVISIFEKMNNELKDVAFINDSLFVGTEPIFESYNPKYFEYGESLIERIKYKIFEIESSPLLITTEKYNGKECYKIVENFGFNISATIRYIEKETFLPVATIDNLNNQKKEYNCQIREVTDEEIDLPDLSNYYVIVN